MKPLYFFLVTGFLWIGCSRQAQQIDLFSQQSKATTEKHIGIDISRQAKSFPVSQNSIAKSQHMEMHNEVIIPRSVIEPKHLKGRKIILEFPVGTSTKKPIPPVTNLQFVIQALPTERRFSVALENDIFDMTDRYYTNGVRLEWSSPRVAHSPLSRLFVRYGHPAANTYTIYLVQNIYTPISTKIPPTLSGKDRPYSSYMMLGHRRETIDATRQMKITNDIIFGVIGSNSLGSFMQKGMHNTLPSNDPPLGWETQINNDVIADYRVQVEKILTAGKHWQFAVLSAAEAGTLYDNASMGFRIEAGRSVRYNTTSNANSVKEKNKFCVNVFLQGESRLIGYDATLQGGMFNRDNTYTLASTQIERLVMKAEAGLNLRYRQLDLELGQTYLTPEYTDGKSHKWGRIKLNFYF